LNGRANVSFIRRKVLELHGVATLSVVLHGDVSLSRSHIVGVPNRVLEGLSRRKKDVTGKAKKKKKAIPVTSPGDRGGLRSLKNNVRGTCRVNGKGEKCIANLI
jgi:hypothetical protein